MNGTTAGMTRDRMALAEIARIANAASGMPGATHVASDGDAATPRQSCRIMPVPPRLRDKAAHVAVRINPVNAPLCEQPVDGAVISPPQRLALLVTKYWGAAPRVLSVSFMESTPADVRARIISHMNAWGTGLSFAETGGTGEIRISREPGGYWSYLGTDNLLIPPDKPTMNLERFSMGTSEAEFRRVVRHEAGHAMGFPHEHMRRELVERIDRQKAYAYFQDCCGWPPEMVDQQVLTPLEESSIFATPPDQDSIMCYPIPAAITVDGLPIRGGADLSSWDIGLATAVYPPLSLTPQVHAAAMVVDWEPAKDVAVPV
ncbi:hypothetical protein ACVCAH_13300 [Micromonospora sp. LZ34]